MIIHSFLGKLVLTVLWVIGMFFIFSLINKVEAQSIVLSPSTGSIATNGTQTIDILVEGLGGNNINAAQIDLTVPSPLVVTSVTPNSSLITAGGCAAGGANFSANQVCFSVAKGSNFSVNESLGTFVVQGNTSGSSTIVHGSTSSLAGDENNYTLSGTEGVFTVGSGTLPNTAFSLTEIKEYQALIIGFFLIDLGLIWYFLLNKKTNT